MNNALLARVHMNSAWFIGRILIIVNCFVLPTWITKVPVGKRFWGTLTSNLYFIPAMIVNWLTVGKARIKKCTIRRWIYDLLLCQMEFLFAIYTVIMISHNVTLLEKILEVSASALHYTEVDSSASWGRFLSAMYHTANSMRKLEFL